MSQVGNAVNTVEEFFAGAGDDHAPAARRHHVVEVRATGVTPEAVAARMQEVLDEHDAGGWTLREIQPVIYNSSTTGYLLLIFERDRPAGAP